MSLLPNHFDRSMPFYPLVVNFISALHGWQNLLARGVGRMAADQGDDALKAIEDSGAISQPVAGTPSLPAIRDAARLPAVMWRLILSSRTQDGPIEIDHDELADETLREFSYLAPQMLRAAEQLLIVAWEITQIYHTHEPLWEFLRHCRNAAAHGGRFTLRDGEPRRPAAFRQLEIRADLRGRRLFGQPNPSDPTEAGLLWIGDAIALLWDIEQAYPQMTA